MTYAELEARFVSWAQGQPAVRGAVVVGSRARTGQRPADAWSDLDLVIFVTDPAAYITDPAWLGELGEVWAPALEGTGRGDPEWRVLFAGGLKADFVFTPVPAGADLPAWMAASPYPAVFARGARPLLDKGAGPQTSPPPASPLATPADVGTASPPLPDQAALEAAVFRFLVDASRTARLLRRGELWRAAQGCNCRLPAHLLTLVEWHARALTGPGLDTWHEGRFLEDWAPPGVVAALALPAVFAGYDPPGLRRALLAALALYAGLGEETAARLDLTYPAEPHRQVVKWVESLF